MIPISVTPCWSLAPLDARLATLGRVIELVREIADLIPIADQLTSLWACLNADVRSSHHRGHQPAHQRPHPRRLQLRPRAWLDRQSPTSLGSVGQTKGAVWALNTRATQRQHPACVGTA
jgi:hypothetical protein